MSTFTITLLILISFNVHAEYRAYQYLVKDKSNATQGVTGGRIVVTTHNPVSYLAYYGGKNSIEIELLSTWVCYGHTANKKICPSMAQELEITNTTNVAQEVRNNENR